MMKLINEMTSEIKKETNLLLEFWFWTVDRAYTMTKDMPSITIVAKNVANLRQ
jgi:hypothetical protein